MKALSILIIAGMLAGCSGMRTSGSSSMGSSYGSMGSSSSDWASMNRHDNPADIYFGG